MIKILLLILLFIVVVCVWVLYLADGKHFCHYCGIAYVYSLSALNQTHCDKCGNPLSNFKDEYNWDKQDESEDEEIKK